MVKRHSILVNGQTLQTVDRRMKKSSLISANDPPLPIGTVPGISTSRNRWQVRSTIIALACLLSFASAVAEPIEAERITVIDGDTIRIDRAAPSIRLVGFNAPETTNGKYACEMERELGVRARSRLRGIVEGGDLDFHFVACSCPPGTEGRRSCNYGRKCGTLRSDGHDVGDILIAEGLAVPFVCGPIRCPKTPRPWCS